MSVLLTNDIISLRALVPSYTGRPDSQIHQLIIFYFLWLKAVKYLPTYPLFLSFYYDIRYFFRVVVFSDSQMADTFFHLGLNSVTPSSLLMVYLLPTSVWTVWEQRRWHCEHNGVLNSQNFTKHIVSTMYLLFDSEYIMAIKSSYNSKYVLSLSNHRKHLELIKVIFIISNSFLSIKLFKYHYYYHFSDQKSEAERVTLPTKNSQNQVLGT